MEKNISKKSVKSKKKSQISFESSQSSSEESSEKDILDEQLLKIRKNFFKNSIYGFLQYFQTREKEIQNYLENNFPEEVVKGINTTQLLNKYQSKNQKITNKKGFMNLFFSKRGGILKLQDCQNNSNQKQIKKQPQKQQQQLEPKMCIVMPIKKKREQFGENCFFLNENFQCQQQTNKNEIEIESSDPLIQENSFEFMMNLHNIQKEQNQQYCLVRNTNVNQNLLSQEVKQQIQVAEKQILRVFALKFIRSEMITYLLNKSRIKDASFIRLKSVLTQLLMN